MFFLAETVEAAEKPPEPEGEPADQNANAIEGEQRETGEEGQEKQEGETEETAQVKEGEEQETKEEEPKQEGIRGSCKKFCL